VTSVHTSFGRSLGKIEISQLGSNQPPPSNIHSTSRLEWLFHRNIDFAYLSQELLRDVIDKDHYACWYLDPDSSQLVEAIFDYASAPPDDIILSHGSDLGLELAANTFAHCGDKVLIISPTTITSAL
jgi:histidinol-phosphate/aromatic aminotransferase/cobyric acid decarboxylase-like protein